MKLTTKKLKQLILETMNEELLSEVAKGPNDLPEGVYIKVFEWLSRIMVMFTDADGSQIFPEDFETGKENPVWGEVSFFESDPDGKDCDDTAVIAKTEVADGWGPFLYDIAMEIATMRSNGLAPDRWSVSDEAYDVWDFYEKNRSDVKKYQLDDEYNTLTPEEYDNCGQHSSREVGGKNGLEWDESPLSKRYTKPSTTLDQIRDRLIWEL
jgi:hypothetical protein